MNGHINQWPPVLLRRWLLQAAIAPGCLFVGVVMFLAAKDHVLLTISILLALCIAIRCAFLHRLISNGAYEVVEGVCIQIKNAPLNKQRSISLLTKDETEQVILLDKQAKVQIGNRYRVYFQQAPEAQIYLTQDRILALEDLGEYEALELPICPKQNTAE